MLVSDYMSPAPVTIKAGADYKQAFGIMQEKNLHHLPVVDGSNGVVGIVTRRDLQIAAQHFHEAPVDIGDVMHTPVTTIPAGADLATAVDRMIAQGIGCLPVTGDSETELVGIITEIDMLRVLRKLLPEK
jgi:acetoin utilization protein AcuB